MKKQASWKKQLRKVWYFIWEDNSIWSWIANVVIAFVLIKFMVYPGLGFLLATSHPVVAVVSGSMEHNGLGFDVWWEANKEWYEGHGISKEQFSEFSLRNGFNKGDIMILMGKDTDNLAVGDVIVFRSRAQDPIIHRIVTKTEVESIYIFETKGDNNPEPITGSSLDETHLTEEVIIGKAVVKIPLLGYIKIGFVELMQVFGLRVI